MYRNTGAACSSSVNDESNAYDATGNRTQTVTGGATTNFAYDANGQLCKVGATTCTSPNVTYDSAGRTATYNGWAFLYDAEGRLTSACQSSSCAGSGFNRVDDAYDGQGHRTSIVETTSGGVATTTTFVYQGDGIASESVSSGITRSFVTDDTGRIVKMTVTGDSDPDDNATFLVAWNGHGDAASLWRQNADGSVTLANSYTYTTWGAATTTVSSPFSDLGFRYLYVGASDVQSDNTFNLGLLYMHARHYAPALGRFLQPDPARADSNMYAYASSAPVSSWDPTGTNSYTGWTSMRALLHPTVVGYWVAAGSIALVCLPFGGPIAFGICFVASGAGPSLVSGSPWELTQISYSTKYHRVRMARRNVTVLDGDFIISKRIEVFYYDADRGCAEALHGDRSPYSVGLFCRSPIDYYSYRSNPPSSIWVIEPHWV